MIFWNPWGLFSLPYFSPWRGNWFFGSWSWKWFVIISEFYWWRDDIVFTFFNHLFDSFPKCGNWFIDNKFCIWIFFTDVLDWLIDWSRLFLGVGIGFFIDFLRLTNCSSFFSVNPDNNSRINLLRLFISSAETTFSDFFQYILIFIYNHQTFKQGKLFFKKKKTFIYKYPREEKFNKRVRL